MVVPEMMRGDLPPSLKLFPVPATDAVWSDMTNFCDMQSGRECAAALFIRDVLGWGSSVSP